MAFLGQTFSADDLPQGSTYDPLPPGWYTATIADAELKTTKDGSGQYIKIRYDITGHTHQGRVVFGNLNIKNASAKAEEIGRQQLGEIMRAIGLARVTDTDQLIGGSLSIKLDVRGNRAIPRPKRGQGLQGDHRQRADIRSTCNLACRFRTCGCTWQGCTALGEEVSREKPQPRERTGATSTTQKETGHREDTRAES